MIVFRIENQFFIENIFYFRLKIYFIFLWFASLRSNWSFKSFLTDSFKKTFSYVKFFHLFLEKVIHERSGWRRAFFDGSKSGATRRRFRHLWKSWPPLTSFFNLRHFHVLQFTGSAFLGIGKKSSRLRNRCIFWGYYLTLSF